MQLRVFYNNSAWKNKAVSDFLGCRRMFISLGPACIQKCSGIQEKWYVNNNMNTGLSLMFLVSCLFPLLKLLVWS